MQEVGGAGKRAEGEDVRCERRKSGLSPVRKDEKGRVRDAG